MSYPNAPDPADAPLYTIKECKARLVEIDTKIQNLEDEPEQFKHGPVSVSMQGRMEKLQKERERWEKHYREAKAWHKALRDGKNKANNISQGPSFNLT